MKGVERIISMIKVIFGRQTAAYKRSCFQNDLLFRQMIHRSNFPVLSTSNDAPSQGESKTSTFFENHDTKSNSTDLKIATSLLN